MIMKDAAEWLRPCLTSIGETADTIVIGDTGSRDNSIAIAEEFGAEIHSIPWTDDFAAARNAVNERAKGDWLLQIDADEELDADGAHAIREAVDKDGDGADAFEVIQANYCADVRAWRWRACERGDPMARGHAGYIAVPIIRLYRNNPGFEYREPIHENITESVLEHGGRIARLDVRIHHYGYAAEGEARDAKLELYLRICEQKIQERPYDAKAWYDLAEQRTALGKSAEGEAAARRAVERAPENVDAITCLAKLLLARGELEEARELLANTPACKHLAHFQTALSAIALRQGRNQEAFDHANKAVHINRNDPNAHIAWARANDVNGNSDQAGKAIAAASAIVPGLQEFRRLADARHSRLKGEALFKSRDIMGALQHFTDAIENDPEDPITHNNIGVVCAALGDTERAKESLQRALKLAPGLQDAQENLQALM